MTTSTPLPGPGWHPDPHQPGYLRYWDGSAWTAHTSQIPPAPALPVRPKQPWFRTWWAGAAAVVVVIGGFAALVDEPADTASASLRPVPQADEDLDEPTSSEDLEPTTAVVPTLIGLDRGDADRLLEKTGLTISSISKAYSGRPPGTVLEQDVVAGSSALLGAGIALVIAKAIPAVPGTAGRLKGAAIAALKAAGYRVVVSTETRTSGTDGAVLRQDPVGGTRLKPGATVRIVVARIVRPVVAAPQPSNCTPGYEPCLTPMSDYDCAGGSGDGPGYAYGPVYVTGGDPYDLDYDGDGVACES